MTRSEMYDAIDSLRNKATTDAEKEALVYMEKMLNISVDGIYTELSQQKCMLDTKCNPCVSINTVRDILRRRLKDIMSFKE